VALRGRLIALGAVVAVLFAAGIIELVRTRPAQCTVAAPRPLLPPALRALGDFDQAYPGADRATLEDAAARAAGALHADLIGATPQPPVAVAAAQPAAPDALVVPLRPAAAAAGTGSPTVAGLAVFLLDCQGNAYFSAVEDDATAQPPLASFPPVSRMEAAAGLGSGAIRLEYTVSPLRPRWATTIAPLRSLAAR
jgi:hypothetical protein